MVTLFKYFNVKQHLNTIVTLRDQCNYNVLCISDYEDKIDLNPCNLV